MFNIDGYNVVDIIIMLALLLGGILGLKDGIIKKSVEFLGLIAVILFSLVLKNNLSAIFYAKLPFFHFWGLFKGLEVINILFYEILAFVIIASLLMILYKLLISMSKLIEKILKATVILAIPSKILGIIVGLIEAYVLTYIGLVIFTLPLFNIEEIHESKMSPSIIEKTPILSKYNKETFELYDKIYTLVETREEKTNETLNEEALILMLDYDVITKDTAIYLIENNKIYVNNKNFLDQYQKGE